VFLPLAFATMQSFFFTKIVNWWRNALLMLHYPTVIYTVFCSYLGTVPTNRKELIPDIAKRIANANKAYYAFFMY
jgi:hypothetical protein